VDEGGDDGGLWRAEVEVLGQATVGADERGAVGVDGGVLLRLGELGEVGFRRRGRVGPGSGRDGDVAEPVSGVLDTGECQCLRLSIEIKPNNLP
jgi:hypothetical protein